MLRCTVCQTQTLFYRARQRFECACATTLVNNQSEIQLAFPMELSLPHLLVIWYAVQLIALVCLIIHSLHVNSVMLCENHACNKRLEQAIVIDKSYMTVTGSQIHRNITLGSTKLVAFRLEELFCDDIFTEAVD